MSKKEVNNKWLKQKQYAIMEVKKWINSLPKTNLEKIAFSAGSNYFTPNQVLEEIKNETKHGKRIIQLFEIMRLDLLKRKESK